MTKAPTIAERDALTFLASAGGDGVDEADLIAHIERNNRVIHRCRVRDFSTAWRLMQYAFEHIRNEMVRIVKRSEAVILDEGMDDRLP